MTISITDNAWKKINENLSRTKNINLRIGLNSKGCGGSSYVFTPTNKEPDKKESYIENNGIKVILDQNINELVQGSIMDWVVKDRFNEGFDLSNPKELGRCGCGQSVILK